MSDGLGLTEAVSIALGGMVGGGIYAVLGVVVQIAGPATWVGFVAAGTVAACAAYSYHGLNRVTEQSGGSTSGGSVTFIQSFTGNATLAGMVGWTLLVGYLGSIAMYAVAFGEFAVTMGLPGTIGGVATRPAVSVLVIVIFVGLNILGARATGSTENVLVAAKVGVLVSFGVAGVLYLMGGGAGSLRLGFGRLVSVGPVVAAAVSFVAFQGWQLLFYDQESLENPVETIGRAVAISIPVAVLIYVLVAVATVNLVPQALARHPHTALSKAGGAVAGAVGFGRVGRMTISLSALVSTGSAINATLFSTGYLAKGMLDDGLLPDRVGDATSDGVPTRTILLVGAITAVLAGVGSLGAVTTFASLSFIVVFGSVSYLAFQNRDAEPIATTPPLLGLVGTATFLPLLVWHLWTAERATFITVAVLSVVIVAVEVLYFEREVVRSAVQDVEREFESDLSAVVGSSEGD